MGRTTNNNNTSPGMEEYDPPPDTRGVLCQNNNNYSSSGGDGDKTPGVISSLQGEERRIIKPSCPPPVKLSSSSPPPLSVTRTQQLNSNNKLSSSAETSFIIDGCKVERSRSSSSVLLHRRRDSNQLRVVATSATTGDLRQYVGDLNQSVVVSSTRDLTTKDLDQCVVTMPTSATTARELSQCHVSSSATRDDSCHLSQLYVSRRNSSSTTTASIIISRHGERRHDDGEQDGEEGEKDAAADSNNNDHAPPPDHHHGGGGGGGGGEQRRTSAVEMLRRSLVSVSKSPSLNLNNNNRLQQHQRSSSHTDANSNDRDRGRSGGRIRATDRQRDECGDCQKKKKSRSEETTDEQGSTPSLPVSDSHTVDLAPECFHTVSGTTTTSTLDGSLSAAGAAVREHVYCTVYCIVNDDRRSIAKTTDAEIKVAELIDRSGERSGEEFESGREDEREEEDSAVYGSIPEPYTLDDLVDPLSGEEGGVGRAVRCCRVCLDDKAISPLHCCRKAVCGECLKMYVSSQVRVGRAYITCPIPECFGLLEEGLVVSHLANEEVGKYRYFLELSRLDASTKPCPHCSLFTSLTTPPVTRETKYKIQCSKCQFVWCFKCHAPWHDGLKCRDYRRGDKLLRHWASVVEHGQRNAQKCPQCKIHIQRTEGCDHMTCTQCNTNFCYRCGERYRHLRFFGDHTSNLSVFGCKYRYLPDKPHLRRLVRGSVCVSKVVIAPVVIVLVVVLGALSLVIGLLVFPVYYVCKRRRKQQQSQGSGRWI